MGQVGNHGGKDPRIDHVEVGSRQLVHGLWEESGIHDGHHHSSHGEEGFYHGNRHHGEGCIHGMDHGDRTHHRGGLGGGSGIVIEHGSRVEYPVESVKY